MLDDFEESLRKLGCVLDWMLSISKGNSMTGYLKFYLV